MLRALRRVLRSGGRLALTTIELAEGLSPSERRRAARAGPRAISARRPYLQLLSAAGFDDAGMRDVTEEYLETLRNWIRATEPVCDLVAAVDGEAAITDRLQGWREDADVVARGWMKRRIYWATRP